MMCDFFFCVPTQFKVEKKAYTLNIGGEGEMIVSGKKLDHLFGTFEKSKWKILSIFKIIGKKQKYYNRQIYVCE